ncbi:hypothetical protein [Paenibacillus sp. NPDC057934]|uniref:hypothetical protein n=1 Tax=Paenibacillus sp. NPDC057934 TaxID=3346282 RepID=UPI0036D7B003
MIIISKFQALLFENVNKREVSDFCEGVNGLVAVTENMVYLVRGGLFEKKTIKTYTIKSIISVGLRKPNMITNGHFQIITSGNSERTKRFRIAFYCAKDEHTITFKAPSYDHFTRLKQLIYKFRDKALQPAVVEAESTTPSDDVLAKIEKLASLKEKIIITVEEFEKKRGTALSNVMDDPYQYGYPFREKHLIEESKKIAHDPYKLHFKLESLAHFYLQHMYTQPDAAKKFVLICRKDIELYFRFLSTWSVQRPNERPPVDPVAFKELTLYYENRGMLWDAMDICYAALHYGVNDHTAGGYASRLVRLEKKLQNQWMES